MAKVAEEVIRSCKLLEREPEKKLDVDPRTGEVNPYFYEDGKLTREGKARLERLVNEGLGRIQKKREALKAEGKLIRQSEEQLKKRKEKFALRVKSFEERYENLKMQPFYVCS